MLVQARPRQDGGAGAAPASRALGMGGAGVGGRLDGGRCQRGPVLRCSGGVAHASMRASPCGTGPHGSGPGGGGRGEGWILAWSLAGLRPDGWGRRRRSQRGDRSLSWRQHQHQGLSRVRRLRPTATPAGARAERSAPARAWHPKGRTRSTGTTTPPEDAAGARRCAVMEENRAEIFLQRERDPKGRTARKGVGKMGKAPAVRLWIEEMRTRRPTRAQRLPTTGSARAHESVAGSTTALGPVDVAQERRRRSGSPSAPGFVRRPTALGLVYTTEPAVGRGK